MTYLRVIPRDLFNEASLLKCLGALWIALENKPGVRITHDSRPFDIRQDEADGSIYAENVRLVIAERLFDHRRPLNSREPWPLWVRPAFDPDVDDIAVFDQDGALSGDFIALLGWPTPMRHRCATCGTVDGHVPPDCPENQPPDDPLPEGVFERDGTLMFTCRACDQDVPLECDLDEYDPAVAYCGGSPRCLP